MIVIINSGPLMAPGNLGLLDLLSRLYGTVKFPTAVFNEVVVRGRERGYFDAFLVQMAIQQATKISTAFQNTVVIAPFVFGVASVNAIIYCWATPVFIDSNRETWNMNSELLAEELDSCARKGKLPMAAMVVD